MRLNLDVWLFSHRNAGRCLSLKLLPCVSQWETHKQYRVCLAKPGIATFAEKWIKLNMNLSVHYITYLRTALSFQGQTKPGLVGEIYTHICSKQKYFQREITWWIYYWLCILFTFQMIFRRWSGIKPLFGLILFRQCITSHTGDQSQWFCLIWAL